MLPEVVTAEVLGGYPRSERTRKILRNYEERGEVAQSEAVQSIWSDTVLLLGVQLGAGLDVVVDPAVEWHDPLRPFVEAWRNVTVGGLLRWFDNNFFYRVPVFVDLPDPMRFVLSPRVRFMRSMLPRDVKLKVVLPGPLTFVKLSKNLTGKDAAELAESIKEALSLEVKQAVASGADVVQLDEPFLADVDASVDDARLAVDLANDLLSAASSAGGETRFAVYYGVPSKEVYSEIVNVKADYLILDVVSQRRRAIELLEGQGAIRDSIGLGLVDGRNLYMEKLDKDILPLVEKLAAEGSLRKLLVTTSTPLYLLPFGSAIKKTELLGRIKSQLGVPSR
jgi:5-methyltetrahydropteroyltriglutamate--homocysteine methyltransferase